MVFWALAGKASARDNLIFDSDKFWDNFESIKEPQQAWQQGQKSWRADNSVVVYYNSALYSFVQINIPYDQEKFVQSKITNNYRKIAEIKAINTAGLFILSDFECEIIQRQQNEQSSTNNCQNIKLSSISTSDWDKKAFSIVKLPAYDICRCKKDLNNSDGKGNYESFFGAIARQELERLYNDNNIKSLINFFTEHYNKKIFGKEEILIAAEMFAEDEQTSKAEELLNILTNTYMQELSTYDWEKCGDIYYKLNLNEQSYDAYINANKKLYN
jgi:hypothetical protein